MRPVGILNARNNTRNSAASNNKDYKGGIYAFGDTLAVKYDKLELKEYFGIFKEETN